MFCSHCGKQIADDTKFCPHCGAGSQSNQQVQQPAPQAQPVVVNVVNTNTNANTNNNSVDMYGPRKSRWVAFFLCFFFGGLGIHKFYVGKIGTGILYLFTVGLFGIGWAIDTLVLLFGGSRDKWGRPLV